MQITSHSEISTGWHEKTKPLSFNANIFKTHKDAYTVFGQILPHLFRTHLWHVFASIKQNKVVPCAIYMDCISHCSRL